MSPFPLAPFLVSLPAGGIPVSVHDYRRIALVLRADGPWTLARLRGALLALLVSNEEQEAVFLRRFDSFFSATPAESAFAKIDLERALQDLHALAEPREVKGEEPRPLRARVRQPEPRSGSGAARPYRLAALLPVLLCVGVAGWLYSDNFRRVQVTLPPPIPRTETAPPSVAPPPLPPLRVELTPNPFREDVQIATRWAGVFFLLTLGYGWLLWRPRRVPHDQAPQWNPEGPRAFHLGDIGGQPEPRLDAATLDHFADSLGYFRSALPSQRLNVSASITATSRNGGLPTPLYYPRQQLRRVLIVEDSFSAALAWNPVAGELAAGLTQRGVPVLFGRCHGSPARFHTEEGTMYDLEDLADQRRGYLVLIFSDGKGLQRRQERFVLEALAHWPMVVWMEPREPRAWDESTVRIAHAGLPVYPATRDGLLAVIQSLLTEHGARQRLVEEPTRWRGLPPAQGASPEALATHVEMVLGDALPWAQTCAMLQPLSLGMADALRREFCSTLPPERIERLFVLPGTTRNAAGLHFAPPVLAILRQGFPRRWTEADQEAVLRFLLHQIAAAKPTQTDSLAYLAWEFVHERVRLELAPDHAVQRLAALAQTPLGNAVQAEMERCVLPGQHRIDATSLPLRKTPHSSMGLQRLARLAPLSGAARLVAKPVAWRQWATLGLFLTCTLSFLGWGVQRYRHLQTLPSVSIDFVSIPAGTFRMGADDAQAFDDERPVHEVTISQPFYLGTYEVTQAQWQAVMGANPSSFTGDLQRPVESVSWEEVQAFLWRLNAQEERASYRLPTEAEWEYAARAGSTTAYSFGDESAQLGDYAWYGENSDGKTHPVGKLKPNAWGLYDMHGNVWEWVQDWYDSAYYLKSPRADPQGPVSGSIRVLRGGSWIVDARVCRSANRDNVTPGSRDNGLGFRLLRTIK